MLWFILSACTSKFDHLNDEGDGTAYRLDLSASCADGICSDRATYAAAEAALGEPDSCAAEFSDILAVTVFRCDWAVGVSIAFEDANDAGVLGEYDVALYVSVYYPWDGTSAQSLGVGSAVDDVLTVYGDPDYDYGWHMFWVDYSFSIWDWEEDGVIDEITLY